MAATFIGSLNGAQRSVLIADIEQAKSAAVTFTHACKFTEALKQREVATDLIITVYRC